MSNYTLTFNQSSQGSLRKQMTHYKAKDKTKLRIREKSNTDSRFAADANGNKTMTDISAILKRKTVKQSTVIESSFAVTTQNKFLVFLAVI